MANIGKSVKETNSTKSFVPYKGVANFKILAVNPTKSELDAIMGSEQKEPVYSGTDDSGKKYFDVMLLVQGHSVDKQVVNAKGKTEYIKETVSDMPIQRVYFRLYNEFRESQTGKVMCIDKTARTKWIEKALVEKGELPEGVNEYDQFGFCKGYKKCYRGLDQLLNVLKKAMCVRDTQWAATYRNNLGNVKCYECNGHFYDENYCEIKPVDTSNLEKSWTKSFPVLDIDSRCFELEDAEALVKGDISEIKSIVGMISADNESDKPMLVKLMLGTRVNDKGYVNNSIYTAVALYHDEYPNPKDGKYYAFNREIEAMKERAKENDKPMTTSYSAAPASKVKVAPTSEQALTSGTIPEDNAIPQSDNEDLPF